MKKIIIAATFLALSFSMSACSLTDKGSLKKITEGKEFNAWEMDLAEKLESYGLEDDEKEKLQKIDEECDDIKDNDYKTQLLTAKKLVKLNSQIEARLEDSAKDLVEKLGKTDVPYASEDDKKKLSEYSENISDMIKKHDFSNYKDISESFSKLVEYSSTKLTGLDVNIVQFDYTNYPTVRMYVDVKDSSGNVVTNLSPNMFYVSQKSVANGDFQSVTIKNISMLDQKDALNIDMVADTSSSMEGERLSSAKTVMSTFLNTVQFNVGDKVKLTEFNSYIDKSGVFTSDVNSLNQKIFSYVASGQTKLYDTLIYAVQDVSGIPGAKCVLAFTDGEDVGSYNSASDVVNVVSSYKIPVYIVRIGDNYSANDPELMQITSASGGEFKYFSSFGMDMGNFYNSIYTGMKKYYEIEYEMPDPTNYTDKRDFNVYVKGDGVGGSADIETNSGNDFFNTLLGNFLRSYIEDMNSHSYNQLASKIDDTVSPTDETGLKYQMSKQVTGGFANVVSESLMSYSVSSITVVDENTIKLAADEDYDVILDRKYSSFTGDKLNQLNNILYRNSWNVGPDSQIRIWERVNQKPEYVLKKGSDGVWRFSQYSVDPGSNATIAIYDAVTAY